MMTLSNQQFDRTRRLALSLAGIELAERHRDVLKRRSERLGIVTGADLDALLGAVEQGEAAATQRLVLLLTTKHTSFFRHPRHFEMAAAHVLQVAGRGGKPRLWSAAAASGEEPCSLAMALLETFPAVLTPPVILATDIDLKALQAAEAGEFTGTALRAMEPARRARFFRELPVVRRFSLVPEVRRLMEFKPLNLTARDWPISGPFDVIFCRNVLMYLEAGHRQAVIERMAALLAGDGLLFLDPAEHLGAAGRYFAGGAEGVYSLRRREAAGRGPDLISTKTRP